MWHLGGVFGKSWFQLFFVSRKFWALPYCIPKKQRQRKKHDKHAPHTRKNCRCSRKSVFPAKTVLSFEKRAVWGGEEKNGLSGELVLLCTFYYKNMFICRKTVFLSKKQEKQRVCGACFVVVFSVLLFSVYGIRDPLSLIFGGIPDFRIFKKWNPK